MRMKKIVSTLISVFLLLALSTLSSFATAEKTPADGARQGDMPVAVNAKSAILMDCSTGKVLLAKNEHDRLNPASVTKIMTMLLVAEAVQSGGIKLSDEVRVSADASKKGGSQIWLKEGEVMSVDELLKATAIGSANDAACALAEHIAGSEEAFVALMNKRAAELGMNDTDFENCTGLDDETVNHLTSAYDIALMSRELIKHDMITKYTTVWMDTLRNGATQLVNTNKLVRFYAGTTGLKTGTTSKAGHCLSATALRDGTQLCAVVLGAASSSERFEGAKAMLNYGFSGYETVTPKVCEELITEVSVLHGVKRSVAPVIPEMSGVMIKKGMSDKITQTIDLSVDVQAPVEKGQVLGKVVFSLDGSVLGEYNLTAGESVDKISFFKAVRFLLSSLIN